MDGWVVLAPTRWKLREAVRSVNQTLAELKVQEHPDKTFAGRVSRGFGVLGNRFSSPGLIGVAVQTVVRWVERMERLYEQGADARRIGDFVRRWCWVGSGLGGSGLGLGWLGLAFVKPSLAAAYNMPLPVPAAPTPGA